MANSVRVSVENVFGAEKGKTVETTVFLIALSLSHS